MNTLLRLCTALTFTLSLFLMSEGMLQLAQAQTADKDNNDKEKVVITVATSDLQTLTQKALLLPLEGMQVLATQGNLAIVELPAQQISLLSHVMHEEFKKCGGFVYHQNREQAQQELQQDWSKMAAVKSNLGEEYSISEEAQVRQLLPKMQESRIRDSIVQMSRFQNRYYQSTMGVEAMQWIKGQWEQLVAGRTDAKVELFRHEWSQPSVILTIEGREHPEQVVVLGGHGDSIAGYWNRERARAPGADDNASGIAAITEVIRVMAESDYVPARTLKFMAYAAEEVGLRGSADIAQAFKNQGVAVVGVMQLDMVGYKEKDSQLDIVMMSDFTNREQNQFLGQLIDHYLQIPWGYSECGYGCSDHVSWTRNGFASSIPFEGKMEEHNRRIHTDGDTIEYFGGNANHAVKFAKLALSYTIEMAK